MPALARTRPRGRPKAHPEEDAPPDHEFTSIPVAIEATGFESEVPDGRPNSAGNVPIQKPRPTPWESWSHAYPEVATRITELLFSISARPPHLTRISRQGLLRLVWHRGKFDVELRVSALNQSLKWLIVWNDRPRKDFFGMLDSPVPKEIKQLIAFSC